MTVICNDCLDEMRKMESESISCIVTDPPYGLRFMGNDWDVGIPHVDIWKEALRISKPGTWLLCFGGTRTYHRLTCAIEDAGWEIRDCLMWIYGSGFPKGKGCLKPSYEPIVLARKSASKPELNIDKCRIGIFTNKTPSGLNRYNQNYVKDGSTRQKLEGTCSEKIGRWPANTLWDEEAAQMLDEQSGILSSGKLDRSKISAQNKIFGNRPQELSGIHESNSGGASRFFKVVAQNDSFIYDNESCGIENITVEDIFAGKKKENKNVNLSIDGFGNKISGIYRKDSISTIKTEIHSIIIYPIWNASTKTFIGCFILKSEKDISWLMELDIENVNNVKNGNLLINFKDDQQVHIKATALFANESDCKHGEIKIGNTTINIIEIIEKIINRFFYCAKASPSEKQGSTHPTMKPLKLMEYLINLIMPKDGILLDPFAGSGTTILAAKKIGVKAIGIDSNTEYCTIANERLQNCNS